MLLLPNVPELAKPSASEPNQLLPATCYLLLVLRSQEVQWITDSSPIPAGLDRPVYMGVQAASSHGLQTVSYVDDSTTFHRLQGMTPRRIPQGVCHRQFQTCCVVVHQGQQARVCVRASRLLPDRD